MIALSPMSGFYDRAFRLLPAFLRRRIHPLDYRIRESVEEVRDTLAAGLVLDAGCGESWAREVFKDWHYLAVDLAVGDPGWNYRQIDLQVDLTHIPLRSCSVDLIVNTQVLEHVPDPAALIQEFSRVLQPGGTLLITAPQGWHEHQQPHDFFRFTRYSLAMLLEAAGFSRPSVAPMGGYFHYLGHRLTYIPKILFQERQGFWRVILFPVEIVTLLIVCFVLPLLLYYLDGLDKKKEFTLGYLCLARK